MAKVIKKQEPYSLLLSKRADEVTQEPQVRLGMVQRCYIAQRHTILGLQDEGKSSTMMENRLISDVPVLS